MVDWNKIIDPTDIRVIMVFSFICYIFSLLYAKYVTPHIEGYVDLEERTRERIIKNRNEREKRSKEALQKLTDQYTNQLEQNEGPMERIDEEREDDDDGAQDNSNRNKKGEKKKKKKPNKKAKEKAKAV